MARPENAESPEANMIRDELREAANLMAEASGRAAHAVEQAMTFLRSQRQGPRTGAVRMQTPAAPFTAGVPVQRSERPGGLPGLIREDGEERP